MTATGSIRRLAIGSESLERPVWWGVVGALIVGYGAVPIVGLLGAFVSFYATVAAAYCYARGFDDATSVVSAPEPPEVDPAV